MFISILKFYISYPLQKSALENHYHLTAVIGIHWFLLPPLSKYYQGHMGFWQIPPSSFQEYLGSKWTVETGAYPKTWQLVLEQSYSLLWKRSPAPKHSDKSWNFRRKMLELISAKLGKYFTHIELGDSIGFPRPPTFLRLCTKQHRLCWP